MAKARSEASSGQAVEVPGPDGKARVLVTSLALLLQRLPDGPLEELHNEEDEGMMWREKMEYMQELAKSVRWSPGGTRVGILREYKRGSGPAVFTLASRPATEIELELEMLQDKTMERYGVEFRHGRFYYISLARWIDEDHLEIKFSGNLELKTNGDPEFWQWYHGSARIELGAKTGKVQGEPKWEALTKDYGGSQH